MELSKTERALIEEAIAEWKEDGRLSTEKAEELVATLGPPPGERQQVARYFFIVAISCSLLAFAALFLDEKLLERFRIFYAIPDGILGTLLLILSGACFWWLARKRKSFSSTVQEAGLLPGAVSAIGGLVYLLRAWNLNASSSLLLFITSGILFGMSVYFRSLLLWLGALISLCAFYAVFAEHYSTVDRFLGMNYPVRFAVFGLLLGVLAMYTGHNARLAHAERVTWHVALVTFFTAMWGVSIFGNYHDLGQWQAVRQSQVLVYGLLFAILAAATLWHGIRKEVPMARDYGLLFLLLNLYTRYFEFFWETTNKGLFFLALALSFFGIGWLLMRGGFWKKERVAANQKQA